MLLREYSVGSLHHFKAELAAARNSGSIPSIAPVRPPASAAIDSIQDSQAASRSASTRERSAASSASSALSSISLASRIHRRITARQSCSASQESLTPLLY